jgi:DNA-binding NtrC family response regulator
MVILKPQDERSDSWGFSISNMQQTQVLTYGIAGVLAERLRELAQAQRFRLRETSQLAACQNLLQASPPSIFMLVLGRDLERELALLEEVHACLPGTPVLVVGEGDHPALAGLAWELGATFALFPPTPVESIMEIVLRLLPVSTP